MGEEEKKPEEKKAEEKEENKKPAEEEKKEDEKEEKKEEKAEEAKDPPPPPEEIVLRVYMHCEGCARKVKRCLKGFEGVEDVQTDCKSHKVVVKGKKADPVKVLERIQRKSHRKVELLTPIPKPPAEEVKKAEEEKPKGEEKKEEPPVIVVVVLKVHMHCEACAQEIKKRIQKMKGVESAEPDLKSSLVSVKGVFDPPMLVEYVYKRTGKHAVIVKQEPEKKEEEKGKEETEKKGGEEGEKGKGEDEEKKEKATEKKEGEGGDRDGDGGGEGKGGGEEETIQLVQANKNEFYTYFTKYPTEYVYIPPPQIFSDENPNACTVM